MTAPVRVGPYPSPQSLATLVASGQQQIRTVVAQELDVVERHNAYVDYCLALLFAGTGHRVVQDPFESIDQFDLDAGLLLVSDKVVEETRAWHLVALPPMVAAQVRAYRNHLANLAHYLRRETGGPALAAGIGGCSDEAPSLPLFFYLDREAKGLTWRRVGPAVLASRWRDYWPFPASVLRHVHATALLDRSGRADWVELQLGHVTGVDHPCGITSTRSPLARLQEIGTCMDEVLVDLGWQAVPAPTRRPPMSGFQPSDPGRLAVRPLGHALRAMERERNRAPVRSIVKAVIAEAQRDKPLRAFDADDFQRLILRLVDRLADTGFSPNPGLRLIYRLIRRQPGGQRLLRRIGRIRQIDPEPSPFAADALVRFRQLGHLRLAFHTYLDQQGRDEAAPDVAVRLAEIAVSAALYGGLANLRKLRLLCEHLLSNTFRLRESVFVDIPLTEESESPPVQRWYPDPTSSALIIGLPWESLGGPGPKWKSVEARIRTILRRCVDQDVALTCRDLVALSDAGLCIEAPGYLRAVLNGQLPAVSLPLPQYVRVVTDSALNTWDGQQACRAPARLDWLPDLRSANRAPTADESHRFVRFLRHAMAHCRAPVPRGHVYPSTKAKRCLATILQRDFAQHEPWSSAALLLAGWTVHLCRHGTRFRASIQHATVVRYVAMVAKPVLRMAREQDFLELTDAGYEQVYVSALDWVPDHQRPRMAGRLEEFHHHLLAQYAVDEPDWAVIWRAAGSEVKTRYADANLLTEAEYLRVLACVTSDSSLPERLRLQYGALLIIGYRCGLRFGEALRLLFRDLQYTPGDPHLRLVLSSSIYGELKTEAGQRCAVVLETLGPEETRVLDKILADGEAAFALDRLAPLMAAKPGSRVLIDRVEATQYLHAVMRAVTGDASVRYHHLRHGWATRMVVAQHTFCGSRSDPVLRPLGPVALIPSEWDEFAGAGAGHYPLRAIATAMGHAQETTTIGSYVHGMDAIAQALLAPDARAVESRMSDFALAYSVQVAHATIRSRRRRLQPHETLIGKALRAARSIPEPPVTSLPRAPTCPEIQGFSGFRVLSLPEMDTLLRLHDGGARTARNLAHTLMLRPDVVEACIDRAAEIERRSGYTRYGVERDAADPMLALGADRWTARSWGQSGNDRVRQVLSRFEQRMGGWDTGKRAVFRQGIEVWTITYDPRQQDHVVTTVADLDALRSVYRQCFGPQVQVQVRAETLPQAIVDELAREGYVLQTSAGRVRSNTEKSAIRSGAAVRVSLSGFGSEIASAALANRIFFLLALWSGLEEPMPALHHASQD